MNIELFAFSKRKNSTKVPASTGTVVTCVLKEETSQLSPAFELDTDPTTFNYVKWGNWYYYISDCTYQTNHKWRIDCVADCLATYRSAIHGTSAFIEYADSYDARIYDPRLAKKINATEIKTDGTIDVSDLTGYFVITSIGDNGSGTFLFKGNDWGSLSLLVNDLSSWYTQFIGGLPPNPTVQDVLTTLAELLVSGNVAENLKSVKWIPLPFNAKYNHTLHLGLYNTQVQCEKVSPPTITGTQLIELDIPHPSNVMLRSSNTCEYSLYLPFVGNVSLSADLLADESKLYIQPSWAVTTGELVYEVFIGSLSKIIGTYGATVACEIPVGSAGIGFKSLASSLAHGAISAAAGVGAITANATGEAAGALATTSIKEASAGIKSIQGTTTSTGGLSSSASAALTKHPILTCSYWDVTTAGSNLTSLIGNPYYKSDLIGNHGYVRCSGASVDIAAYDSVTNIINQYLGAGIYVE